MAAEQPQKPWYKRPLPLVGLGIIALLVIAAIAGGGSSGGGGSVGVKGDGGKSGGGEQTVDVGEAVTVEGTRYRLISAKTASSVGGEFTTQRASGIFVIVKIELTNEKSDTHTINSDAIKLITANDKSYSPSTDAVISLKDPIIFQEIQPDVPKTGTLLYDIPPSQTSQAKLRVEDLFSNAHAFIRLGI